MSLWVHRRGADRFHVVMFRHSFCTPGAMLYGNGMVTLGADDVSFRLKRSIFVNECERLTERDYRRALHRPERTHALVGIDVGTPRSTVPFDDFDVLFVIDATELVSAKFATTSECSDTPLCQIR